MFVVAADLFFSEIQLMILEFWFHTAKGGETNSFSIVGYSRDPRRRTNILLGSM